MAKRKLIWHLFPSYLLLTLACLAAVGWYSMSSMRQLYTDQVRSDLEAKARLLEPEISDLLRGANSAARLDALCKKLGREPAARITVILHGGADDGRVVGDSYENPAKMENHSDRPEIQSAVAKGVGDAERYSYTLKRTMKYVAVPVTVNGRVVAVVRTSLPLTQVEDALRALYERILIAGLVIAALAAAVSWFIARRIARPLGEIRRMAEAFAGGDLHHKGPVEDSEEITAVAEAMNTMATQLDERIRAVTEQRNELEAVLLGMVEVVVVVDMDERVVRLNQAAGRYFAVDPATARGKSIQEIARNSDLQRLVTKALSGCGPVEAEVELEGENVTFLQAHGTGLCDATGKNVGAVIVLNDVTRLKRLETIRRDFAANVSHELRTPVTSVKGFLETLREGKVTDPADRRRFLDIALRETDRLNAIIEDLLSLSRIEKEYEQEGITREPCRLKEILEGALSARRSAASEKNISLALDCDYALMVTANAALLTQAVVNLIDNAVKYSEPGSPVTVAASADGNETVISVRDEGCGIAPEHLSRIFERFYRVDKGRSRKLGGTGLGLAIVKHIVLAHGGRVSVESRPGEGSTFRIILPVQ